MSDFMYYFGRACNFYREYMRFVTRRKKKRK